MGCGKITTLAEKLGIQAGINVLEDISTDFEGAGISLKFVPLKKNQFVIQHKHKYPHLSVLLSGKVLLESDGSQKLLDASIEPQSIVIPAGAYHQVTALSDAVWLCVHNKEDEVK